MGEIRKDNLHESLIEELNELANIDLSGKQDKTDESLLTESKDVIGAINELFQSANNGKELIASAIGEPLNAEDTFSAMSNDINGLLSTFKTNMMKNGITVESSDKFKSLIDKIATMVEEGEGKGIQYAEGSFSNSSTGNEISSLKIQHNLGSIPELVFVTFTKLHNGYNSTLQNVVATNLNTVMLPTTGTGSFMISVYNLNETEFTINISNSVMASGISNWYAIGVGEEDTTLRDSLASILQEEGVSVTEEDNMASLISKVDSEFDRQVVPAGDAVAEDVIAGKTFINSNGELLTGNATLSSLGGIEIKQIYHTEDFHKIFILDKNGNLYGYGNNGYGQFGIGTTSNNYSSFTKLITEVKQVYCSGYNTFIIKNDGSLWACGYNTKGSLGLGNTTTTSTFTQVTSIDNNSIKKMSCHSQNTFIIKNDGTLWGCGGNYNGQLGTGSASSGDQTTFIQLATNVSDVECGLLNLINNQYFYTIITKNDGSVWYSGYLYSGMTSYTFTKLL